MDIGHSEGAIQKRETFRIGRISQFKEPPPPVQSVTLQRYQAHHLWSCETICPSLYSWVNIVAAGIVPTLAVAIGVYLIYRHYKK